MFYYIIGTIYIIIFHYNIYHLIYIYLIYL